MGQIRQNSLHEFSLFRFLPDRLYRDLPLFADKGSDLKLRALTLQLPKILLHISCDLIKSRLPVQIVMKHLCALIDGLLKHHLFLHHNRSHFYFKCSRLLSGIADNDLV